MAIPTRSDAGTPGAETQLSPDTLQGLAALISAGQQQADAERKRREAAEWDTKMAQAWAGIRRESDINDPGSMVEFTIVFARPYNGYQAGQGAGFRRDRAAALVQARIAVGATPEQDKYLKNLVVLKKKTG